MTNLDIQGIYQIRNVKTNESYIGSSRHVFKRLRDHLTFLSRGSHINKILERSWNDYGAPSFIFLCVEEVPDAQLLSQREIYWIEKTQAHRTGFNRKTDQYKRRTLFFRG
jgi:group I intron endonuclease